MKDTKTMLRLYTVPAWEKEQEFLRQQHKSGWKFVRVTGLGCYHFVRCQPEDVIYQLDYNKEGLTHKGEYIQMFADCGWEYLQEFAGYSYFRKAASAMTGDEQIFCDDESRMDMVKRVFRGRMVPLLVILFACIIPNLWIQRAMGNSIFFWLHVVLLVVYLVLFARFSWLFYQKRRQMR